MPTTLEIAQDNISRHPLVKIISSKPTDDIPFGDEIFSMGSQNEYQPFLLEHSFNRTILITVDPTDNTCIRYSYTDINNVEFKSVQLPTEYNIVSGISCVELPNGNVGIIYLVGSNDYTLKYKIVTPVGVVVTTGTIGNWALSYTTSHTWVVWDAVNSRFYLVYSKYNNPNYNIVKRTSSDFITWSSESIITPSGVNTTNKISNPSLLIVSNGEWLLSFDYSVNIGNYLVGNIYYSVSTDQGTTWGTSIPVTNSTTNAQSFIHPIMIERTPNNIFLTYTKELGVLSMVVSSNYPTMVYVFFNSATGKLYQYNGGDNGPSLSIREIDIDSWQITKTWTTTSVPAIPSYINNNGGVGSNFNDGAGPWLVMSSDFQAMVLNIDDDAIKIYSFRNDPPHLLTKNVQFSGISFPLIDINGLNNVPAAFKVDPLTNRLYVTFTSLGYPMYWGYIDLLDAGQILNGITTYTMNIIGVSANSGQKLSGIDLALDFIYLSATHWGDPGEFWIYTLSTGLLYKHWMWSPGSMYPYFSIGTSWELSAIYCDGNYLYGCFPYQNLYGEEDKRGLLRIDLATNDMVYFRPTCITVDEQYFADIIKGPDNTLILTSEWGILIFDTVTYTWRIINHDTIPQLENSYYDGRTNFINSNCNLHYDSSRHFIYAATPTHLYAIPWQGTLKQSQYQEAIKSGGSWTFSGMSPLVKGYEDYNAAVVVLSGQYASLVAFWEYQVSTTVHGLKWDIAQPDFDLSDYIVSDTPVVITKDIVNSPNKLKVSFKNGHLFDYHNKNSLLCMTVKKGRKLTVQWGETVSGVDYWQNAGVFYVASTSLKYEKGVYTDIAIEAEDLRRFWGDNHIFASDYYNDYPEVVLADVIKKNTNLTDADLVIPNMDNRIIIEHQWIDMSLEAIVEQICNRFGYFARITDDNKFSIGKISNTNTVDHAYLGSTKLNTFEPDDTFSDFTNRVTVIGQSKDFIIVTYPEELVGQLHGTCGWWGMKKDFDIWYSLDGSRTCIEPRLVVLESSSSIAFNTLGGGGASETISYVDPNNKYCKVEIEVPDLTGFLVSATLGLIACAMIPDTVVVGGVGVSAGQTIRVGTFTLALMTHACMTILGAVANYQLEIHAKPQGKVRRQFQATADDIPGQTDIGTVILKKIEDPLCYSMNDCTVVANFELLIVVLQRKRVKIQKIADLRDKEGDTITIYHPYSGILMTLYIVELSRSYKKSEGENTTDGYFYDDITGWVL